MVIGLLLDDTLDRPDGVQQAMLAIGLELTSRGHEVHYIVPNTTRNDIKNIHSLGSSFSLKFNGNSVRTPYPIKTKNIVKLFSEIKFDVLHVQMPFSPIFTGRILQNAPSNIKKFGTFHILPYGDVSKYGTMLLGTFLKDTIKNFDKVFAVSKPANDFMYDTFKTSGVVIPNPVNYKFFSSFKKSKKSKIQLVFVGRFEDRKGVLQLIEAYSKLPIEIIKTTELTMCGKGPLLDKSKIFADELSVKIKFPGFVTDEEKAKYLADADIAVFPSIKGESFGIVLAEAMSAKAGITIAGNNPGYSSVLDKWPEVLFNPKNIEEFTNTLERFISNPKIRKSIGSSQHIDVQRYDTTKVVDELLKYYASTS